MYPAEDDSDDFMCGRRLNSKVAYNYVGIILFVGTLKLSVLKEEAKTAIAT